MPFPNLLVRQYRYQFSGEVDNGSSPKIQEFALFRGYASWLPHKDLVEWPLFSLSVLLFYILNLCD